jgi:hypothetical protein
MADRENHEGNFRAEFVRRYGDGSLGGKQRYVEPGKKGRDLAAEVSSDESFKHDEWLVLVEIDAFNVAKPSVGQYFLLNHLCTHERDKTLFLVLNHYSGFNEQRTSKYMRYASSKMGINNPIGYLAMTKDRFWSLCDTCKDIEALIKALTNQSAPTQQSCAGV